MLLKWNGIDKEKQVDGKSNGKWQWPYDINDPVGFIVDDPMNISKVRKRVNDAQSKEQTVQIVQYIFGIEYNVDVDNESGYEYS